MRYGASPLPIGQGRQVRLDLGSRGAGDPSSHRGDLLQLLGWQACQTHKSRYQDKLIIKAIVSLRQLPA
jgi:hypothetical protein